MYTIPECKTIVWMHDQDPNVIKRTSISTPRILCDRIKYERNYGPDCNFTARNKMLPNPSNDATVQIIYLLGNYIFLRPLWEICHTFFPTCSLMSTNPLPLTPSPPLPQNLLIFSLWSSSWHFQSLMSWWAPCNVAEIFSFINAHPGDEQCSISFTPLISFHRMVYHLCCGNQWRMRKKNEEWGNQWRSGVCSRVFNFTFLNQLFTALKPLFRAACRIKWCV